MSIPIIDLTQFYSGTKSEQSNLATRVTQELQKNGAVRLINHGIPAEMINECYEWVSCTGILYILDMYKCRKERAQLMSGLVITE